MLTPNQVLIKAILAGEAISQLENILNQGADVWSMDSAGNTCLHLVMLKGHTHLISWLLQQAPTLAIALNQHQQSALHLASQHHQTDALQVLLSYMIPLQIEVCLCQQDAHGKLPLFYAVYHNDPLLVETLLEQGANVKAIVDESYGSTALHVAAFWGQRDVLPCLIAHGASLTALNHTGHTPIEVGLIQHPRWALACLSLSYPLNNSRLKAYLSPDMLKLLVLAEQYNPIDHWQEASDAFDKLRQVAEQQCLLPIQIYCVSIQGLLHLDKASILCAQAHQLSGTGFQTKSAWREAAQRYELAAKFFNAALAYIINHADELSSIQNNPLPDNYDNFLYDSLQAVSSCMAQELFKRQLLTPSRIKEYRQAIAVIPRAITFALDRPRSGSLQDILAFTTGQVKALLKRMIVEAELILGKPPCCYAAMGLGSMSRQEISPCSDIEWALLFEKDTVSNRQYFRKLAQWVNLSLINLGQTPLRIQLYSPSFLQLTLRANSGLSPTPQGLRLDDAFISPLGHPLVESELMGEPKAFAQWVMEDLQQNRDLHSSVEMFHTLQAIAFIHGEPSLTETYVRSIHHYIQQRHYSGRHQTDVLQLLKYHIEKEFPLSLQQVAEHGSLSVKTGLYRPVTMIINDLTMYYGIKEQNTWERIAALQRLGYLSQAAAKQLTQALEDSVRFRLLAHLHYGTEYEALWHPSIDITTVPTAPLTVYKPPLLLDDKQIVILKRLYAVLVPFYQAMALFLQKQGKSKVLQTANWAKLDPVETQLANALSAKYTGDITQAINHLKKALGIVSNNPDLYVQLLLCLYQAYPSTSFALSNFTVDNVVALKNVVGIFFEKINALKLENDAYKNTPFTQDEIDALQVKLAEINTEYAKQLSAKFILGDNSLQFPVKDTLVKLVQLLCHQRADGYTHLNYYALLPDTLRLHYRVEIVTRINSQNVMSQHLEKILWHLNCCPDRKGGRETVKQLHHRWNKTIQGLVSSFDTGVYLYTAISGRQPLCQDAIDQLLVKGQFRENRVNGGQHNVIEIKCGEIHLFVKENPELPGMSFLIERLHEEFIGHGTTRSELALLEVKGLFIPILLSLPVPGSTLQEILEKNPQRLAKLNHRAFSERIIMALITNPEDGLPTNEIAQTLPDGGLILISVDHDHAMFPPFIVKANEKTQESELQLNVKTILYCLPQMHATINSLARKAFLQLDILQQLRLVLQAAQAQNKAYEKLSQQLFPNVKRSLFSRQRQREKIIPVPIKPGDACLIYHKALRLQRFLRLHPEATLMQCLLHIEPRVGLLYAQSFIDEPKNPIERLRKLGNYPINRQGIMVSHTQAIETIRLSSSQTDNKQYSIEELQPEEGLAELDILAAGQKELAAIRAEVQQGNLTRFRKRHVPEHRDSIINGDSEWQLAGIDWAALSDNQQQALLQALIEPVKGYPYGVPLYRLNIVDCHTLTLQHFERLLRTCPDLTWLDVSGHPDITEEQLRILAKSCKTLQVLVIKNLPRLTQLTNVTFMQLRQLVVDECPLRQISLNAPQLQILSAKNCTALTQLTLPVSDQLQVTKLRGCVQLPQADFMACYPGLISHFTLSQSWWKDDVIATIQAVIPLNLPLTVRQEVVQRAMVNYQNQLKVIYKLLAGKSADTAIEILDHLDKVHNSVIQILCQGLKQNKMSIREAAAQALGQLGKADAKVISALIQVLDDELYMLSVNSYLVSNIRTAAVKSLGQLGRAEPQVITALLMLLKHKDLSVREAAAQALGQLGKADAKVISALIQVIDDVRYKIEDDENYRYKVSNIRTAAVKSLGQLGKAEPQVITALLKALKDKESSICNAAIESLVRLGEAGRLGKAEPQVITALLKALKFKYFSVPNAAIESLVRLGEAGRLGKAEPQVITALLEMLDDEVYFDRAEAIRFLIRLGKAEPQVITALLEMVEDKAKVIRLPAVKSLGRLGNAKPQVINALLKRLEDEEPLIQVAAVESLCRLGKAEPRVITALLKMLDELMGLTIFKQHKEIKLVIQLGKAEPQVMAALLKRLEDEREFIRLAAVKFLGRLGRAEPEVIAALLKKLEDKEEVIRLAAVKSLGRLSRAEPQAIAALLEILESTRDFDRNAVIESLVRLGEADQLGKAEPQVITALLEMLEDKKKVICLSAKPLKALTAKRIDVNMKAAHQLKILLQPSLAFKMLLKESLHLSTSTITAYPVVSTSEQSIDNLEVLTNTESLVTRKQQCNTPTGMPEVTPLLLPVTSVSMTSILNDDIEQTSVQPLSSIQNYRLPQNLLSVRSTKDDRDCAFHASLGEWDKNEQQFVCHNVAAKREAVKEAILASINESTSPILQAVQEAIQEAIIDAAENHKIFKDAALLNQLIKTYQAFEVQHNQAIESAWQKLEANVMFRNYVNLHGATNPINKNLKARYGACLNDDSIAKALELQLTEWDLQEAYRYDHNTHARRFAWLAHITPAVINEYITLFIVKEGQWLLPGELKIIAHVFNLTVVYYPTRNSQKQVFNPDQDIQITVVFDGIGHFERVQMEKFQPILDSSKTSIPSTLEKKKNQHNHYVFFTNTKLQNKELIQIEEQLINQAKQESVSTEELFRQFQENEQRQFKKLK